MAFKHKFTYEEKARILTEYMDGVYGFREICSRYQINQGSLKAWKRLYDTFGWEGLRTGSQGTHYSRETKWSAVQDKFVQIPNSDAGLRSIMVMKS